MPNRAYFLLMELQVPLNMINETYYGTEALMLFNVEATPFIYASQFDIIKNHIRRMFRRQQEQPIQTLSNMEQK